MYKKNKFKIYQFINLVLIFPTIIIISCTVTVKTTSPYTKSKISYQQGVTYFQQNKYKEADSCFTNALNELPNMDAYFNRANTRLKLNNIQGFCMDLKMAKDYTDKEANRIYFSRCIQTEDVLDSISKKIISRDKYQNYYEVTELSLTNDTLAQYYYQDSMFVYTKLYKEVYPSREGEEYLLRFIGMNVYYPDEAKEKLIMGKVFLSFIIDEGGKINNIKILRGVHPLLDKSAINVINKIPNLTPAKYKNKPVKFKMVIPINYRLN